MNSVPILHTDRCTLSAVTQNDIHVLRQILDDVETQRFLSELCEEFQTAESLQHFVASFDKYLTQYDGLLWGIRKENVLIGFIAIMDITTNPTLFYAMHPEYRYQGYMKECLVRVLDDEQTTNFFDILQTEVYPENKASRHLLKCIGFQIVGAIRQKKLYRLNISTRSN